MISSPDCHTKPSLLRSIPVGQLLSHLYRTIESREGRDVVLLFAGEAVRLAAFIMDLLASYLQKLQTKRLKGLSKSFITMSHINSMAALTTRAADRTKSLYAMLDEWQIMNRLWGVLDMWMAARNLIKRVSTERSAGKPLKLLDIVIQSSQILCLTSFHVSEAISFLSSKGIIKRTPKSEENLTFLAIRSWAAFSFIEVGRLSLDWMNTTQDKEKLATKTWKAKWKSDMLQNLAWASVASHWSLKDGLIPEAFVSPLAVFATWSLVKDAWKNAA
ncbi:peroxin 11C [Fusarium beomiforme]|uniref:Peroxin 11C n=1 Tax=Fusarium beomiforme TaxID=44412 RepID=A0A9P5AK11_9HYPO|nr:peroxin 11C [Fusarium beomiforme]